MSQLIDDKTSLACLIKKNSKDSETNFTNEFGCTFLGEIKQIHVWLFRIKKCMTNW